MPYKDPEKKRENHRQWRKANPEKCREYGRKYRDANRDKARERNRKYREAHPDTIRATTLRWRKANPEKCREYTRRFRETHPETARKYRESNREKHRKQSLARYHRMGGDGYRRHLPALLAKYGYVCQIKGCELPQDHSQIDVDHIVPVSVALELGWSQSEINDPSNLQPACPACNYSKCNRWDGTLPGEPPIQLSLFST